MSSNLMNLPWPAYHQKRWSTEPLDGQGISPRLDQPFLAISMSFFIAYSQRYRILVLKLIPQQVDLLADEADESTLTKCSSSLAHQHRHYYPPNSSILPRSRAPALLTSTDHRSATHKLNYPEHVHVWFPAIMHYQIWRTLGDAL